MAALSIRRALQGGTTRLFWIAWLKWPAIDRRSGRADRLKPLQSASDIKSFSFRHDHPNHFLKA
jgi:hypothetical protein